MKPNSTPALILTVNVGSASVKLDLFRVVGDEQFEHIDSLHLTHPGADPTGTLKAFMDERHIAAGSLVAAAHRIVHGGALITGPSPLTAMLDARLDELVSLAPLHNPVAFAWLRCARDLLADTPQVLVPDTGFFATLPEVAQRYALPGELVERQRLRRYGFHGLAHRAMLRYWQSTGALADRVITVQLGAGCSMAAIRNSEPIDTSMGFTPLEGLVMATRSGDVDAGLVTWLQKRESLLPADIETLLNQQSGLLGVSGISGDMAVLLKDRSPAAEAAVTLYVYRAKKYLGAYMAALGGADAILFGGGVGEHAPEIRARICEDMRWCGIEIDAESNAGLIGETGVISADGARPQVGVVVVDEARLLAEDAYRVVLPSS